MPKCRKKGAEILFCFPRCVGFPDGKCCNSCGYWNVP